MARSHSLAYIEASRAAIGLKIVLTRFVRGIADEKDIQAIAYMKKDFHNLMTGRLPHDRMRLLARPEGIRVARKTSIKLYGTDNSDQLKPLEKALAKLLKDFKDSGKKFTQPVKDQASELSNTFKEMHQMAEELAALSNRNRMQRRSKRAITTKLALGN